MMIESLKRYKNPFAKAYSFYNNNNNNNNKDFTNHFFLDESLRYNK